MKKKRAKAKKKSGLFSLRYLLPAGFFLALSVFLLLGLNRNPNEIPSPLIGKAAPEFALPRLADAPASIGRRGLTPGNGNTSASPANAHVDAASTGGESTNKGDSGNLVSSQALRGQPYLLNVWASWCMPCLQEHPQMVALAQSHRIRIVGMNYKDQPADARRWLARNGNPYDEILVDAQGRTAIDFGVYGVPETFLIDAEGRIRYKLTGALSVQTLQDQLLPAIAALDNSGQPSGSTSPRPNPAP